MGPIFLYNKVFLKWKHWCKNLHSCPLYRVTFQWINTCSKNKCLSYNRTDCFISSPLWKRSTVAHKLVNARTHVRTYWGLMSSLFMKMVWLNGESRVSTTRRRMRIATYGIKYNYPPSVTLLNIWVCARLCFFFFNRVRLQKRK